MEIIELAKRNDSLEFLDPTTEERFKLNQVLTGIFKNVSDKKLAFLYLDNSLTAVSVLLNFYDSPHVIALLSPQLNLSYKQNLEQTYEPYFIFDPVRNDIANYSKDNFIKGSEIFINKQKKNISLHLELKLLLSTSGTTGSPKFVKLSEDNILSNARSIIDYLPITHNDVTPLNLPVYYSYGLSVLNSNILAGGVIACTNRDVLMKEFWADFDKFKYNSLAGVPFLYEMLMRIGFTSKKYPTLRYITQAGGKLNEKTIKLLADYCTHENILFYIMYGQTEATARMSYLAPEYIISKLGSIGKPIKNGSFTIDAETSELCYKGPNVFGGYANSKDDLETFSKENVLQTGDMARADEDGFYYITGRLKRIVKIFGTRINLDEIETILKNRFIGNTFVCLGFDDKKLFIGLNSNAIEGRVIKEFISSELKIHPSVIEIKFLPDIPLTENGKIDYKRIYEEHKS